MKHILIFLLITQGIFAQDQYDFAIYHDGDIGAWEDGIIAFEHFLDWKEISHHRVTAQAINTTVLKDFYKAIYFPGGDADYYNADINSTGIQHIQDLISNNGAYIGMCAGAEFACDKLIWEGFEIDYPLNLFQGEAMGPIDELAIWPNYTMTTLTMNLEDEINQFEPESEDILYWGGTVFSPYVGTNIDTIATFDGFFDRPAIIKFSYGNGRVLLISPHPEIEEDSSRDGVNVAEELNDNGTDWNFLWTATDWLLGNPLSEPNITFLPSHNHKLNLKVYPNPAKNIINITSANHQMDLSLRVFNQAGQLVLIYTSIKNTIDLSSLQNGMYILEFKLNNIIQRKNIFIIK